MPEEFQDITGRKPSKGEKPGEEALGESEERFRLLFNEMLVGCTLNEIICDEHGKPVDRIYLEVNPAFERLMGLRREDIIGRRMREVLPEVEPFWIEKYGQVATTGEPAHFEGYMGAVGKYFDVSVFSPQTGQFAVTFVDITEQKRAEQALRESERKFRELAETIEEFFWMTDVTGGRILYASPAYESIWGRTCESLYEQPSSWLEAVYSDDRGRVLAAWERQIREATPVEGEFRILRPDGSIRWVSARGFPVKDQTGQVQNFVGIAQDTTRRKEAETDLRSLLNISRALNSTLDIVSLMDLMIIEAIKFTNAECGCAGLRMPEGMVCNKYFRGSDPIPFDYCWPPGIGWPGWVLVHKVPYLTNDASNDPVILPEIRERFGVKSGIDTPLIDVHGKVIGFFEVNNKKGEARFTHADLEKLTAVSEIASSALQKALAYQKFAEAEESLRQLWIRLLQVQDDERRRISRELHDATGQVLTALAMKLGVARRALGVDEGKAREALAEGLALTKQCSDDIRTLSYLLHSPVLEEGGLEAALRPYVESFSQRSEIRIDLGIPAELGRLPPEIEAALFRIVQEALTNIHLHSGGSSANIRVVRKPNEVTVEVKDDGQGIPLEILEKIRTRGVMPGVGIASMQERIQQVGGRLNISSGEQGAIIRATVPLSVEDT